MKQTLLLLLAIFLSLLACVEQQEKISPINSGPKTVEAIGYVFPTDSMAVPKVIEVDESKLKKIPAGNAKVVLTNTNVHLAGIPKVVTAGTPRVCTPGQDTFLLPKTVPAIDSPFIAGIPEVVLAKDPAVKDQNPQNFSSFGKLQGLKHGTIKSMMQDHVGNLWVGTQGGGVSRYDGKTFTHFTTSEGLSNNNVRSILEDQAGNLWFGTWGSGVSRYDGKSFTHFTTSEGLSNNTVYSILEDRSGIIWFGTGGGGVSRYDGKSFTHFTTSEGLANNTIYSILEDMAGNLWFGSDGGVSRYDSKSFAHFTTSEGLSDNIVNSILEDRAGNLWFGNEDGGISRYDGKSFTHFTTSEGLSDNTVYSILEDHAGNLWFGTYSGGVSRYDGKSFTHFTTAEGLANNTVYSILEDHTGNLWFGTNGGGISRYDGKSFTHFTTAEGLANNTVRSILEDTSGNLWFGTWGGGVCRYDSKSFTHFTTAEGLAKNYVFSVLEDQAGNLWFGTERGGVSRYDGKSFIHFTTSEGLTNNYVMSILEDHAGNLWFGTLGGGVCRYDGKSFTQFTTSEGLSNNIVLCILEDHARNLWFGTNGGGVCRYDGKSFIHFTTSGGLAHNTVFSILEDHTGNLWFSTWGGGVCRYDGKSFTHITTSEGLANNTVYSILEDFDRNLWFGTGLGFSKLTDRKLGELTHRVRLSSNKASDVFFSNYTYEDGFLGEVCNKGSIYEDRNGTIWIGTNDMLTAYHPPIEKETPDTLRPNIQVNAVMLYNEPIAWSLLEQHKDTTLTLGNGVQVQDFQFNGISKWYGLPENLSLAFNNNSITFGFIGITMSQPKKVKYQYKLDGNDENWSELSLRTEAPYGNLPHGTYTFKVKAMSSAGHWSNEFHYPFTIRPPWWLTWWAYCLYALATITMLWRLHKYQQARTIRIERERTQAKELEQAKEIEKAYSELKATQKQLIQSEKMASLGELTAGIAHEIQNPLNFVNNFSDVNKELLSEMKEVMGKGNIDEAEAIANDVIANEEKINLHGKRADAIVKGMLQHSRSSSGVKEPTDINALADEYLRLAYHGLRAKDKSFNATMKTDYDQSIGLVNVIPQDIGRVILNLITNAFYAVSEKQKSFQTPYLLKGGTDYEPMVTVKTKYQSPLSGGRGLDGSSNPWVEVSVSDNGPGIPQHILDKIFQPFFTTKPTGQGTGLGLSLSYDIIKAHGGELKVNTKEGEFAEFIITLPA